MSLLLPTLCLVLAVGSCSLLVFVIKAPRRWSRYVTWENRLAERIGLPLRWSRSLQRREKGVTLKIVLVLLTLASSACSVKSLPSVRGGAGENSSWPWGWGAVEAMGTLLGAGATFAAVCVALWGEDYREKRKRPILKILAKMGPPYCQDINGSIWIRFFIMNESETTAELVQVWIDEVLREEDDDAHFVSPHPLIPIPFQWTHASHGDALPSITRNYGRCFNFGCSILEDDFRFELDTVPKPADGTNKLRPGSYVITLTVTAKNAAPQTFTYRFIVPAAWTGSERCKLDSMNLYPKTAD
jgi:hypothetical protein